MAWLGGELAEDQQDAATPFAPRCLKDVVEEALFARRRDLFSTLHLVFMDTTSLSFEGAGGQRLGRRGFSKDHRPDLNQMILAVLLDGDGRPVCTEMWPGNTADAGCLIPVVDRLRKRFSVRRVCLVADRGMISAETIAELEARGLLYILGVRERTDKLVRDLVRDDPAPFVPLVLTKRNKDIEYEAKTVNLRELDVRVPTGAYRALPSRRKYIPKADGRQPPLGIAAVEDKIVQAAVAAALTPIYEAEFLSFSYGFRPKRNQHQAPDALAFGIAFSPERSAVRKWNRLDCTGFVIM